MKASVTSGKFLFSVSELKETHRQVKKNASEASKNFHFLKNELVT